MKKLTVLLIAFFISFSSAHAEVDITAALQSGQSEQEVLAQLTKEGMSITDAVTAMIQAAPERADAITKAALIAAPEQAVAINKASKLASDPTANLGSTASGPTPGVTVPTFSTPTSTPSGGGGGVAASPA